MTPPSPPPPPQEADPRFARQAPLLPPGGQEALARATLAVIGAGGVSAPALLYLAGAGLRHFEIWDGDRVSPSNLARQLLFGPGDAGAPKASLAARELARRFGADARGHDAMAEDGNEAAWGPALIAADLVLEGSDDAATRQRVSDFLFRHARKRRGRAIPLVSASLGGWHGRVALLEPGRTACWRCALGAGDTGDTGDGEAGEAEGAHIPAPVPALGAVAGMTGSLAALKALARLTAPLEKEGGEHGQRQGAGGASERMARLAAPGVWLIEGLELVPLRAPPGPGCPFCG